jgi:uncharacterized protein (DUF433 family)
VKRPLRSRDADRIRKVVEAGVNGDHYEYYPLGEFVVIAPGVCGGRPTIKGTRIEVQTVLESLRNGFSIKEIAQNYPRISPQAIEEVKSFEHKFRGRAPVAICDSKPLTRRFPLDLL